MAEPVLVVIETSGIQQYVFGSNRLRENIGASFLVAALTDGWLHKENITLYDQSTFDLDSLPEKQILWAGGGNARVLFKNQDCARRFTRAWSRRLLTDAPGLRAVITHQLWDTDLGTTHRKAMLQAAIRKNTLRRPLPALGLGINAACQSTALPAIGFNRQPGGDTQAPELYPVSQAVLKKLGQLKCANKDLQEHFPLNQHTYPLDFDHLGRSLNDQSYIAVVHIDGNGMGQHFGKIADNAGNDHDYVIQMQNLSSKIRRATDAAYTHCIALIEAGMKEKSDCFTAANGDQFDLHRHEQQNSTCDIPFRPLIYGGDDVTFVCDGRIGLSLAVAFLERFNQASQDEFHACAGVAIVKTHYPFARAYELAEQLCASAKELVGTTHGSAIDWHIAPSGLSGDLDLIREREYRSDHPGGLISRPTWVESPAAAPGLWSITRSVVEKLKTDDQWRDKRNKVMQLREVIRHGATKIEEFEHLYAVKLHDLVADDGVEFIDSHQLYRIVFDAIELLDFTYPLQVVEVQ